jgi:hypothetical protein
MSENPLSSDAGTEAHTEAVTGNSPLPTNSAFNSVNSEQGHPQQHESSAVPQGMFRWVIKYSWIALIILPLVVAMLGIFMPLAIYTHAFMDAPKPKSTVVHNAGRVVSVTQSGGFFSRALVETDLAYYALADSVSLNKNEALTLENRDTGGNFLCDSQHRCQKLMPSGATR